MFYGGRFAPRRMPFMEPAAPAARRREVARARVRLALALTSPALRRHAKCAENEVKTLFEYLVGPPSLERRLLSKKAVILSALLFLALVALLLLASLERAREHTLRNTGAALQTVLHATQDSLHLWLDDLKREAEFFGKDPSIVEYAEKLLSGQPGEASVLSVTTHRAFKKYLLHSLTIPDISNISLVSPDLVTIASLDGRNVGKASAITIVGKERLSRIFTGRTQVVPPAPPPKTDDGDESSRPVMFIISPVAGPDGDVIAAFVFHIDPGHNFSLIPQHGRLGKTGETYCFNKDGFLLTQSRFESQLREINLIKPGQSSILSVQVRDPGGNLTEGFRPARPAGNLPLTAMARHAASGGEGMDFRGYRDYRGVMVIGAWLWDESLDIGMATEIDLDEVLMSFRPLRATIITTLALTAALALTLLLLFFLERSRAEKMQFNEKAIYKGLADARNVLLSAIDFDKGAESLLSVLGEDADVDHAFLYENTDDPVTGELVCRKRHEWTRPGQSVPEMGDFTYLDAPDFLMDLARGELLKIEPSGKEKSPPGWLTPGETAVFMVEPVFVGGLFWGFIGFSAGVPGKLAEYRAEVILHAIADNLREFLELRQGQEALAKAISEQEAIMTAMPDIFYLFDMDGKLVKWNRKMEELTGLPPERLHGRHVLKFVPERERDMFTEAINEVFRRDYHWIEGHMIDRNGDHVPYHFSGVAIRNESGEFIGFAGMGRDITDRKRYEESLKRAKEAAERATKLKDHFVSVVAHDLRNPLTSIQGFLNLLARETENLAPRQLMLLQNSIKTYGYLMKMVDELLTMNKIQEGEIAPELRDHDAARLVDEIISGMASLASIKDITLQNNLPDEMIIRADKRLFSQVIVNLVSNSVKFCEPGSIVTIYRSGENTIAVRDTGTGIDKSVLPNLFVYGKNRSTMGTSNEAGTGLGLPFCAEMVNAQGGLISVESTRGEGSVFYVTLPGPDAPPVNGGAGQNTGTPEAPDRAGQPASSRQRPPLQ